MYDLIGDIHGHADELEQLLDLLGYRKSAGVYGHPERQVIFLGDFVDRGSQIRRVLQIVRPMVEQGRALAVMGNHELNALAFHLEHKARPGDYLRKRNNKNIRQHGQTLLQLDDDALKDAIQWFRTLPLWLDLEGIRVVHACWDEPSLVVVNSAFAEHGGVTDDFLHAACTPGNSVFDAVEILLKGREARLPDGVFFQDKDGHKRRAVRTRWYLPPAGRTYGSYALQTDPLDCEVPLAQEIIDKWTPYPAAAKPVFVGHYWLWAERPTRLAANIACLDYSVAKGGYLCAYRWQGEQELNDEHFVRTMMPQ